jgi:hypothetical protein
LAPQNTVNDDINVPVNRNGIIRNIYFNAKTSDPALLFLFFLINSSLVEIKQIK